MLWEAHRAPCRAAQGAIRIIDASGSLFRAPDVEFRASELGLDAFGYNIANSVLVDAAVRKVLPLAWPRSIPRMSSASSSRQAHARLNVAQGAQICARLRCRRRRAELDLPEGVRDRRLRAVPTGRPRSLRASPIARRIAASRSSSIARAARSPPCR